MDRLSRFRRHKDKDKTKDNLALQSSTSPLPSPASTTPIGKAPSAKNSRTPSPAPAPATHQNVAPPIPPRSHRKEKRSPFRGLHLRATGVGKRARESPPASLPQSPSATGSRAEQKLASLQIWNKKEDKPSLQGGAGSPHTAPRIPHFLTLSEREIEVKFQDLVWLERERLAQSHKPRWARVSSAFKNLDRYMNIQPWEGNRVRLRVAPGLVDYINASPISLAPVKPAAGAATVAPTPPQTQQQGTTASAIKQAHAQGGAGKDKGSPRDSYIAMQGPKQTTVDHVWRMVVEQMRSPAVIVMLTETHEGNMEKCYPYFPRAVGEAVEINERDEFGDGFRASVTCEAIEDTEAGDAIELRRIVIRVHDKEASERQGKPGLHLSNGEDGDESVKVADEDTIMMSPMVKASRGRDIDTTMASPSPRPIEDGDSFNPSHTQTVYHFLYKKWPDFGSPAIEDLESFFTLMRLSRQRNADPANPRIIHCSAGVGRSGTFIALEHLMRALDSGALARWDTEESILKRKQRQDRGDDDHDEDESSSGEALGEDLIYDTVNALREQRKTMVQAEGQYLFLYQVLRKLWQDKYGGGDDEPAAKRIEVDPFVDGSAS